MRPDDCLKMIIFDLPINRYKTSMINYQMISMRFKWTTVLFLCIPMMVFSQTQIAEQDTDSELVDKDLIEDHESEPLSEGKLNIKHDNTLNINYFTGTNFLFSKQYGTASNIYFGAGASYPVAPRFTMEFGTAVNFSRLTDLPSGFLPDDQLSKQNLHTTSITLYARGNYFLSSRLTLSGMAFKQFSPYNYPAINPSFINYNQEGMSFGLNYRLFQNVHIGAQFNLIKSNGPFYPSRLTQPVFDTYDW